MKKSFITIRRSMQSNKFILSLLFLVVFTNPSHSQTLNNLKEINQVWKKFYQAFESLDYNLMADIHSKDLVRISGGQRISDYNSYINNYKTTFKQAKINGVTNNISLRFFERINNDSIASERGIYKLIRNRNLNDEHTYYGQFHVIFKKEKGYWKILMDYDSNEGNSISEDDYFKAYKIDELVVFSKK